MELEYRKLSDDEVARDLPQGWSTDGGAIKRTYEFGEYMQGVEFATKIAHAADAMDHHPDMALGYKRLEVTISTHSVGGLSPYDLELARRIDAL